MNKKEEFVSLDEIVDGLKTGDLVFFQGWGIDSVLIRKITGGRWSHIGIIIEGKDIGLDDYGLLLFESTNRAGKDIDSNYNNGPDGTTEGVMLVEFLSRMDEYSGSEMYSKFGIKSLNSEKSKKIDRDNLGKFVLNKNVRHSIYPPEGQVLVEHFVAREQDSEEISEEIVQRIRHKLTDPSLVNLPDEAIQEVVSKTIGSFQDNFEESTLNKINHNHISPAHYFCSELVADTLMHMGIFTSKNAARYSPNDLSDQGKLSEREFFSDAVCIPSSADKATDTNMQDLKDLVEMIKGKEHPATIND